MLGAEAFEHAGVIDADFNNVCRVSKGTRLQNRTERRSVRIHNALLGERFDDQGTGNPVTSNGIGIASGDEAGIALVSHMLVCSADGFSYG